MREERGVKGPVAVVMYHPSDFADNNFTKGTGGSRRNGVEAPLF
jgi:hypothetical protein